MSRPELPRVAIVGVGQELNGDDGAGPAVICRLSDVLPCHENLLLVNSGHAPENCLGTIIRFRPDIVLFIDTVKGASTPGSIICIAGSAAEDIGGSTHTLSLGILASYLGRETTADIYILGIFPAELSFDKRLSKQVDKAVGQITNTIVDYWRRAVTASSAICEGGISVANT